MLVTIPARHPDPLLVGAVPTWPHAAGWGYGPSGFLGLMVVIILVLVLAGRL